MTTEAIEGNVEAAADNVNVGVEATSVEATPEAEAADPYLAEAERLLEAEAASEPQAPTPALSDDELLRDERILGLIRRREMSAAQKAEDRLRKQAGNDEAVRSYVLRLKEAAETGDEAAYEQSVLQALSLNRQYQEDQVVEFFSNGLKEMYKVPPEFHERAVQAVQSGDRAGYIKHLIDGALESQMAATRAELEAEYKARAARAVAAELKAAKIQAQPKVDVPPTPPVGSAPSNRALSLAEIDAIPTDVWLAKPVDERRAILAAARGR